MYWASELAGMVLSEMSDVSEMSERASKQAR